VLFGRRRKRANEAQPQQGQQRWRGRRGRGAAGPPPNLVRIDFAMMLKGHIIKRGSQQVRQIGVTVNGSTRLVTSGDMVDLATYEALVRAGIVAPPQDAEVTAAPEAIEE
jgi:hypothetical protein